MRKTISVAFHAPATKHTGSGALMTLAALLFAVNSRAPGQDSLHVPLLVADGEGHSFTITLGFDTRAGNSFNWALGERPIPPVPAAPVFDIRFCDVARRRTDYPGLDSYADLRPYADPSQADTFYVHFQPADNRYPIRFSWPRDLGNQCQEALLLYRQGGEFFSVDMARQDTLALGDASDPVNSVVIVIRGPRLTGDRH